MIATDGTVTDAPDNKAYIGGVTIVDVSSREEALQWAAKIAVACRCAQEAPRDHARPGGGQLIEVPQGRLNAHGSERQPSDDRAFGNIR